MERKGGMKEKLREKKRGEVTGEKINSKRQMKERKEI